MLVCLQNIYPKPIGQLPHFKIGRTDRAYFDNLKLKKNTPVLFIYFLPDCDDCRSFTKTLLESIRYLKNTQIVMITNSSLIQVSQFEKDFKLKSYPNIIAGTEGYTTVFQRQFNIQSFPFVAVYNDKGNLIKSFRDYKDPNLLVKEIRSLTFLHNKQALIQVLPSKGSRFL